MRTLAEIKADISATKEKWLQIVKEQSGKVEAAIDEYKCCDIDLHTFISRLQEVIDIDNEEWKRLEALEQEYCVLINIADGN